MKRRPGFTISRTLRIGTATLAVYFKEYNKRKVVCTIVETTDLSGEPRVYEGSALCNTAAGDVFDPRIGRARAFAEAMDRRRLFYADARRGFCRAIDALEGEVYRDACMKFSTLETKGVLDSRRLENAVDGGAVARSRAIARIG